MVQVRKISVAEADRQSKARPDIEPFEGPQQTPIETAQINGVTFKNIPPQLITDGSAEKMAALVQQLNRFKATPLEYVGFDDDLQGGLTGANTILLPTQSSVGHLFELGHEMGHAISNDLPNTQNHSAYHMLDALAQFDNAHELIDDSNYAAIPEGYGHLDAALGERMESIDASAIHAYMHGDQFAHYVGRDDTPQYMKTFGKALFHYLRTDIFQGQVFTTNTQAFHTEKTTDALIDELATQASQKLPAEIASWHARDIVFRTPLVQATTHRTQSTAPWKALAVRIATLSATAADATPDNVSNLVYAALNMHNNFPPSTTHRHYFGKQLRNALYEAQTAADIVSAVNEALTDIEEMAAGE